MTAASQTTDPIALGKLLRELLTGPGRYRTRWLRRVDHARGELNQAAVARVLGDYLRDQGELGDDDENRRIKDRVSRALGGKGISARTLEEFIGAFDIADQDADRLWDCFTGSGVQRVLVDRTAAHPAAAEAAALYPGRWQRVARSEHRCIGADRRPAWQETLVVVRAMETADRHPIRFGPEVTMVEVLHGGAAGPLYRMNDKLLAVDVARYEPLAPGGVTSLRYRVTFDGEAQGDEFRVETDPTEQVEARLQFEGGDKPTTVWWEEATSGGDTASRQRAVAAPNDRGVVQRYVDLGERKFVGFQWTW